MNKSLSPNRVPSFVYFVILTAAVVSVAFIIMRTEYSWAVVLIMPTIVVLVEILRWRGGWLIALLTLAVLFASFLQETTFGSGYAGGVRLPGLIGMSILGLSFALLLARNHGQLRLKRFFFTRLGVCFLGFFIINVFSCIVGAFRYGVSSALTDADWLIWTGVMFLVVAEDSSTVARRLLVAFWLLSILRSFLGLANLLQGHGTFLTTGGNRYVSVSAGQFIAAGLIISSVWFLRGTKQRSQKRILVTSAILQLFAVLLSFNRQTWVALSCAMMAGFLLFFRGRRLRIIIVGMILLSALLTFVFFADQWHLFPVSVKTILYNRIGEVTNLTKYLQDSSIQFRFAAWQIALQGITNAPILGQGWGSSLVFRTEGGIYNMSPHNTYLWLAYKSGLLSLTLYLLFVLTLLTTGLKRYKTMQAKSQKAFLSITILIEILYLVGALWWDYLTAMYMSVPIWLNRGLLIYYCLQNTDQQIEERV